MNMSTMAKSTKATTIAIYSLGFLLGSLHLFLAAVALTPMINQSYHRDITINYSAFAQSLLKLYQFSDRSTVAFYLRILLSSAQAIFGACLIENGHFGQFGKIGNTGLIVVDLIFLIFQLSVGTAYERLAPTIVFTILLVARYIIVEQSARRMRPGVKTRNAGKQKTSTPRKGKND